MSIRGEIRKLLGGPLHSVEPQQRSDPVKRVVVVTEEIRALLDGPWDSPSQLKRCVQLRFEFEAFVRGDPVGICLTPYQHDNAWLGRLDKPEDEVWDIRGRNPRPGLRVFGRFADTDLFVAFLCAPRSCPVPWLTRKPLNDRNSLEWHLAILECQDLWQKFFPGYAPVHSDNIHDYVSENAFDVGGRS